MKAKAIFVVLFSVILAACTPTVVLTSTSTTTLLPASTSTLPVSTPTLARWIVLNTTATPEITATPMNLPLTERDEIPSLIVKMYPNFCMKDNLAILTPPPKNKPTPPKLKFTEIDPPPNQESHYIRAIADNIDQSLQAYIACVPGQCADNIYVKNNKTGKTYEVYFGAASTPNLFPLKNLLWLNKDTFFVGQIFPDYHDVELGSAWLGVAINFNKQEYVYYGIGVRCCEGSEINCWGTPHPTP